MAAAPPMRHRTPPRPLNPGAPVALLIITVATWLAFTKELPWHDPFQFHATFQTSNDVRLDSPVRIAGVNVGEVVKVERMDGDSTSSRSRWRSRRRALPIHKDATAKIRSRIFLEGNFFVDLRPARRRRSGTATAPSPARSGVCPEPSPAPVVTPGA